MLIDDDDDDDDEVIKSFLHNELRSLSIRS